MGLAPKYYEMLLGKRVQQGRSPRDSCELGSHRLGVVATTTSTPLVRNGARPCSRRRTRHHLGPVVPNLRVTIPDVGTGGSIGMSGAAWRWHEISWTDAAQSQRMTTARVPVSVSRNAGRHLITTADERTWKSSIKPVVFLGEWCRADTLRRHVWSGMNATIAEPYGRGQAARDRDHAFARTIEEELSVVVGAELNRFHGTTHSRAGSGGYCSAIGCGATSTWCSTGITRSHSAWRTTRFVEHPRWPAMRIIWRR